MDDRPTFRKYARVERERRFLLEALPPAVKADEFERLDDLYVSRTHLRLRRVTRPDGSWITTKLGQKIPNPDAPDDPRERSMTTIYLPEREGEVLSSLEGLRTVKRRYKLPEQSRTWCIDVWEHPVEAAGTIVAEVEHDSIEQLMALRLPSWAAREVTDDPCFTAIALARGAAITAAAGGL